MSAQRYFLTSDNDGHKYVVPVERRAEWEAWADLPEDDENGWEAPDFAVRIEGYLTFTDPQTKQEWQPIETAPHAETLLLGWWQEDGLGNRHWNAYVGQASFGWRRGSISNMSHHGTATHWMPLPPPPTQEPSP